MFWNGIGMVAQKHIHCGMLARAFAFNAFALARPHTIHSKAICTTDQAVANIIGIIMYGDGCMCDYND